MNMAHYENTRNRFAAPYASARMSEQVSGFLTAVYGWMGAGLVITATCAWLVASSPQLAATIYTNRPLFWVLVVAQLGIVFTLSARVDKLAPATASLLFVAYSALIGVTLSFVLLVYTGASVASTFLVVAMMFAALALYGTMTHRNLQGAGQFLFMGLIGIVLASLVNIFWQNDGLQFVISFIGVIVFTGLTAYDAQRLRAMALALPSGHTGSYAVVGALALYLDFINLFLMMLRFMGHRRN
jgi:FtsH-binding integral membrane protein